MKVELNVKIGKCYCEKCEAKVDFEDMYCSKCGNSLRENISHEIIKAKDSWLDLGGSGLLSQEEIEGLLGGIDDDL